jgi:uncharacterized Zn finger protein
MSRYYNDWSNGWPAYVPVAERRREAARALEKLRKQGHPVAPVVIKGRKIAATFWGKAWCENLESYRDYENRLPRGRTYVRNGSVVDLQIQPSEVTAMVSGSSIYDVKISIAGVEKKQWASICKDCAGGIDSLIELLQGRLSKGVMERICHQSSGLFPKPAEIRFSCSCPDYASMCKHVAAVLYGVGARLDKQPELLFRLRAVDEKELVTRIDVALPAEKQAPASGKVLDTDDLSALFGLDMDTDESAVAIADGATPPQQKPVRVKKRAVSKRTLSKSSATKPKLARRSNIGSTGRKRVVSTASKKRKGTPKAPAQKRIQPKVPTSVRASRIPQKTAAGDA